MKALFVKPPTHFERFRSAHAIECNKCTPQHKSNYYQPKTCRPMETCAIICLDCNPAGLFTSRQSTKHRQQWACMPTSHEKATSHCDTTYHFFKSTYKPCSDAQTRVPEQSFPGARCWGSSRNYKHLNQNRNPEIVLYCLVFPHVVLFFTCTLQTHHGNHIPVVVKKHRFNAKLMLRDTNVKKYVTHMCNPVWG